VDPSTLMTALFPADGLKLHDLPWKAIRDKVKKTPYGHSLAAAESTSRLLQDAGLTHSLPRGKGVVLTIDLCPSVRPLDRALFSAILSTFESEEKPIPLGIAITGVWMLEHPADLTWLRELEEKNEISITWIDHSFNHRYDRRLPLTKNFLLESGTDLSFEILATEKAMLKNGLQPSVFFRFPGLVSDSALVSAVVGYGLIPIGSDAWLAKSQNPQEGSIVLVHGNGNEPVGIERFLELVTKERTAIRHKDWLLFDLRDSVVRSEVSPLSN
jgi:hypothetical protein